MLKPGEITVELKVVPLRSGRVESLGFVVGLVKLSHLLKYLHVLL